MRKKLFTKTIDTQLFKQYPKGNNLEAQKVVAKIFNPYGRGRWYILNSDPQDPDYLWAIVEMNGEIEIGSVSREELETITVRPFGLNLERDLYFSPVNAKEVYDGLRAGEFYKDGGETDLKIVENAEEESFLTISDAKPNSMAVKLADGGSITNNYRGRTTEDIWNNLTENQRTHFMFDHFSELGIVETEIVMYANKEFKSLNENIKDAFKVHTMMGQYADGGYMAKGGGVNFVTKNGVNFDIAHNGKTAIVIAQIEDEDNYMLDKSDLREMSESARTKGINRVELHTNYGLELRSNENPKVVGFDSIKKQSFADGGVVYVDLFEDYENMPKRVAEILDKYYDRYGEDMDYRDTQRMLEEIEGVGYTFDYYLDNQPYGLRPIGVELNQLRGYEDMDS
jgi:hypothetical protein